MRKAPKRGHLYFIESPAQKAVKVGFAVDIYSRTATLQSGNPEKLVLYGCVPIEADVEELFHTIMKPHRIAREWYPYDTLIEVLCGCLIEMWDEEVEVSVGPAVFREMRDERANLAEIYLTAKAVRAAMPGWLAEYFAGEEEEGPSDAPPVTNHWTKLIANVRPAL